MSHIVGFIDANWWASNGGVNAIVVVYDIRNNLVHMQQKQLWQLASK